MSDVRYVDRGRLAWAGLSLADGRLKGLDDRATQ